MEFEKIISASGLAAEQCGQGLTVDGSVLAAFTEQAFKRLSFTFPQEHLESLVDVACDPASSENDRLVAVKLLENAVIAAKGTLPLCQDTGVAQVFAWKDAGVCTALTAAGGTVHFGSDEEAFTAGVGKAYKENNLRFSINIPSSLFDEKNSATNLPAQVDVFSTNGAGTGTAEYAGSSCSNGTGSDSTEPSYRFLFCAKGGGSSNKTDFTCATKALLNPQSFERFLKTKIAALGTAACPPYTIAVVIGGLSPEQNLQTLKLATTGYWDAAEALNKIGGSIRWTDTAGGVRPLRCRDWEERVLQIAAETGLGAQFGGSHLAAHARVFRLPRHGASCFASIGVSCNAHRNLVGYISREGAFLQKNVSDPRPFFEKAATYTAHTAAHHGEPVAVELSSIDAARAALSKYPVGQAFLFSGEILVARDAAHARWKALLESGKPLPDYTLHYPILYAGPAETPKGAVIGSFGPTTANRMDPYADDLMSRGAALITIAKGNRSELWRTACKKYGAFYLGTIGGAAALIAEKHITARKVLDYPDLGMEAVQLISVKDLPVFLITDDKGNDFYAAL
ncbi:fumarate hydratase C-terminal domain-containing protein [Treponema vincentii]|uniref:FumA C-terminus/TtdB family hydratase beta subunit n=1 Tax=Treponema vincentii TaxID=69710 RepID=UPI0020A47335|nr:FumA C-terminus/TtdB family hydratase beta subunit [Treponema vincentii]UTC59113.1 fumarate hydratase C-terminal domain-containing protein [Treponema vincentii]